TFLFTVARNMGLSEIQRKGARVTCYIGDLDELELVDEQCLEDDVDTQQRLAAVLEIVTTLPPQCRRVVIMKKMLGFSHEEIGERLDISPRTVEKHLAKGLERCRDALTPTS
ncbi:MAG TPA: sigma-70 family RNA polymerase sigma factor, partial [Steroidobacteraceae bacterium]